MENQNIEEIIPATNINGNPEKYDPTKTIVANMP